MNHYHTLSLVPLITSTALTTIGIEALVSVPSLLKLPSTNVMSQAFSSYFYGMLGPIIAAGSTSSMISSYLYFFRGGNRYFGWGAFFAGLHFAFVPLIMYPCQTIIENKNQSSIEPAIKRWIKIHKVRLIGDIMATVCFTLALREI
ncbi:uncharacterized protein BX664DRAFT_338895, partial [Halteromyces radiatus]|uniref:uncharacterized protein n=1 Tax=Halteromyces radiatus TaxID=101107 RepID=UPI002220995F